MWQQKWNRQKQGGTIVLVNQKSKYQEALPVSYKSHFQPSGLSLTCCEPSTPTPTWSFISVASVCGTSASFLMTPSTQTGPGRSHLVQEPARQSRRMNIPISEGSQRNQCLPGSPAYPCKLQLTISITQCWQWPREVNTLDSTEANSSEKLGFYLSVNGSRH